MRRSHEASPGLTLLDALADLEKEGYRGQFVIRTPERIECRTCGVERRPEALSLERSLRVEGQSDPADEAVVAGIRCACGARGTQVFTYGAAGSPVEAEVFSRLKDARGPPGPS